ncbi:MAG: iron-containing alcohol dehydrogenase [Anaerolineae bacterium]|jgi:glycerol-1-phosphate dehydrogenase [NAD(P)+]|nr:iron-containing alcohol dehydrogenase [Anaerolineae bacterium]
MAETMLEPLWNIPRVELTALTQVKENRPTAVITGHRAWATVGSMLDLPLVVQAEPHTVEAGYVDTLAGGLPPQVRVVYGVGGGRAADVAKYIGWKHQLPVVLIPTALSVDGFFTASVALRTGGTVRYQSTGPAEKVIVDMEVISHAPAHLRGTGIVEILSMTTGLLDWKFAAERKQNTPLERFQPWAASIAAAVAQQAYKISAQVGEGRPEALRNLLDLICIEVQLTNMLGHNRPQEGSEQYFAYAIEPRVTNLESIPYADLVGPGILLAAAMHRQNTSSIKETLIAAGVRLDQLPAAQVLATLQALPAYARLHQLPYGIVHEANLTAAGASELIQTAGLDALP